MQSTPFIKRDPAPKGGSSPLQWSIGPPIPGRAGPLLIAAPVKSPSMEISPPLRMLAYTLQASIPPFFKAVLKARWSRVNAQPWKCLIKFDQYTDGSHSTILN